MSKIKVPTQVIWGKQDQVRSPLRLPRGTLSPSLSASTRGGTGRAVLPSPVLLRDELAHACPCPCWVWAQGPCGAMGRKLHQHGAGGRRGQSWGWGRWGLGRGIKCQQRGLSWRWRGMGCLWAGTRQRHGAVQGWLRREKWEGEGGKLQACKGLYMKRWGRLLAMTPLHRAGSQKAAKLVPCCVLRPGSLPAPSPGAGAMGWGWCHKDRVRIPAQHLAWSCKGSSHGVSAVSSKA